MIIEELKIKSTKGIELETIISQHNQDYSGTVLAVPAITSCGKRSYYIYKDTVTPQNNLRLITFSYRGHGKSSGLFHPNSTIDDINAVSEYARSSSKKNKPFVVVTSCSSVNPCMRAFENCDYTSMHVINGVFSFSNVHSRSKFYMYGVLHTLGLLSLEKRKEIMKWIFKRFPFKYHDNRYGYLYYNRIDRSQTVKSIMQMNLLPKKPKRSDNLYIYINEKDELLNTKDLAIMKRYLEFCDKMFPFAEVIYLKGSHLWETNKESFEVENKRTLRNKIEESIEEHS